VPLYPPVRAADLLSYTRRQQGILRNADARVLITFAEAERLAGLICGQVPSLETITTTARLSGRGAVPTNPGNPALIQYTSGSTGDPNGVLLTHANILANVRAIGEALDIRSDDVGVSWLPLYHDMGLIGLWLGALYFGVPVSIMSPLAFLSRPSRWLWAIHAHRATVSAAPKINFAFDLCARKITDDEIRGLDLSSWRVAVNGSEAVSPDTIEAFTRRFAPYGFKPEAMCPAYGLAEAAVAVTLVPFDARPVSTRSRVNRSNGAASCNRPTRAMREPCGLSRAGFRSEATACGSSIDPVNRSASVSKAGSNFAVLR
jgi:acyl-CoA synthetase (AMP-forming)/AMP-acid ligase II